MSLQSLFFENRSPKQTVFKNSFWLFLSQGVSRLFKFLLVIASARILGPAGFGSFNYILSIVSLFFIFSDWGIGTLIVRDFQQKKEPESYLRAGLFLKIVLALFLFIVALAGSLVFNSIEFKRNFILLAIFLFVANIRDFIISLFRALQKMEKEFWVIAGESFSVLVFGVILLLLYKNIISLSLAYLASVLISSVVALRLAKSLSVYLKPIFQKELIKSFFVNGAPLALFGLLGFIFFSTDQILLGKMRGIVEVGYYSIATKIILMLNLIPTLIMTALFPYLSSKINDRERMKAIFNKTTAFLAGGGLMLAIFGFLFAPLIPFFVGAPYLPSVKIFQFLIWIIVFMFPAIFLGYLFIVYNKQWQNFAITAFCAILNLVLNIFLIPIYGMFGAAAASIGAQALNFVLSFGWGYKIVKSFGR